jgi:hypothetical protein
MARQGTSWTVDPRGPDYSKICLALRRGDVRWDVRCASWLRKHFDSTTYTQRNMPALMLKHITQGGELRGQHNESGKDYHVWFSINLPMDGQERFIKFAIDPEDEENPGIVIISTHPPHDY